MKTMYTIFYEPGKHDRFQVDYFCDSTGALSIGSEITIHATAARFRELADMMKIAADAVERGVDFRHESISDAIGKEDDQFAPR